MRRMLLLVAAFLMAVSGCSLASSKPASETLRANFSQANPSPFDVVSEVAKLSPPDQISANAMVIKIKAKLKAAKAKAAQHEVLARTGCELEKSQNSNSLSSPAFYVVYGFTTVEYNRRFDPFWSKNSAGNSSLLTNAERKYCTPNGG